MQYTKQFTYSAPAADVYAMIIDPAFQTRRSKVGKPEHAEVKVTPGPGDGATVSLVRRMKFDMHLPAFVQKKFGGVKFTLTETQVWPDSAGSATDRTGKLTASVQGYSGGAAGTLRLTETGGVTTVALNADVTVKIPLIGPKLEKVAAGMLDKLLARDQKIGSDWLAKNSKTA